MWVIFNLFVVAMLALDLGLFHRRKHVISVSESLKWSAFWITLALVFNAGIYIWMGPDKALKFLTGYLIEKSLSVDNIFVFFLIFSYFGINPLYQHKVLFWGILGALIMRIIFIVTGITLILKFHWITYLLGIFLIVSGIKMGLQKKKEVDPERNPVLRLFKRFLPMTVGDGGGKFFVREDGRLFATSLFVVLIAVETTDVVFAADSIPAILAITLDPFIVYTSNVFAILGLRMLYFALAGLMPLFHLLHYGLSLILVFVGIKMLLVNVYKMPVGIALGVVACILAVSVVASRLQRVNQKSEDPSRSDPPLDDEPQP
jgi:tellurite resistance protein TerC